MPVNIARTPVPPLRRLPLWQVLIEAEQRDLGDLRLLRDVLDGQEVAVFAARALREVLQRPVRPVTVGGPLDDELEADDGRGADGSVPRDEPDVPTRGRSERDREAVCGSGKGGDKQRSTIAHFPPYW